MDDMCKACLKKRNHRTLTSIYEKQLFPLDEKDTVESVLERICSYLEEKLKEYGSVKFTLVINPTYQKGIGEDIKYTSPFFRAGPFPLHHILDFNKDYILAYLDFLLDSFEDMGSGWVLLDIENLIVE